MVRAGAAALVFAIYASGSVSRADADASAVRSEPMDDAAQQARWTHGLSTLGRLKYPPGFAHFDYVNPDAPKGGRLRLPGFGTFDSLNGFIRKGRPATGVTYQRDSAYIYDSLTVLSADEPESRYGLLAKSLERDDAGKTLRVELRSEARWHDGQPVTAEDVVFTFETYKEHASPLLQLALRNLEAVEPLGPHSLRFVFGSAGDRAILESVVSLPILPKHYWQERDFEQTTLEPPLGSGPYRIDRVDPGRSVTYARVLDYWARELPVNVGRNNFDEIHIEYFLDTDVRLEALKAGAIDYVLESVSKTWARGYEFPAVRRGDIRLDTVKLRSPGTVRALIFNTRIPKLRDRRVRKALAYAFDREWKNRVQTYDLYELDQSYFPSSDMAHQGMPSPAELALLQPFRDQLPSEVFEGPIRVPQTRGVGPNRENLVRALELLREAGYEVREGQLVNVESGEPFTLELLLDSSSRVRMSLLFAAALERLGIRTTMRVVETAQLINRRRKFAFEMLYGYYLPRSVPGRELGAYFSSLVANNPNSRNYSGVRDPVVDKLLAAILRAKDYDSLVDAARALDRVLLAGYYMIDLGYAPGARIAYWDRFGKPDHPPLYHATFPHLWWYDVDRAKRLGTGGGMDEDRNEGLGADRDSYQESHQEEPRP